MTPATIAPTGCDAPPEAEEFVAETGKAVILPLAGFVEEGGRKLVVTQAGRVV